MKNGYFKEERIMSLIQLEGH